FGGAVPATTEWILKISMLARHSVAFIVGVLVLFFIGMFLVFKTNRVPRQRNFVLTKIPIISRIYKKSVLVKFSRALQTLISSGYSFEMSVEKTLPILEDPVIADRLSSAAREIEAGGDLYEILNRLDLFPRIFFKMIQLGVKTGTLEEMITKFTATYERELEADLTQTTDAIEPVLVAVLSVVIGLILVMVMLPLINIIGAIG
ncbi:MAG: type II secretion system F family protein, partial [Bacillota bacterium]|nr:type II secretion system F family protein [Bacillota bacterium]